MGEGARDGGHGRTWAGRAGLANDFLGGSTRPGHACLGKIHTCPAAQVNLSLSGLMASRWKRRSEAPQARMAVSPLGLVRPLMLRPGSVWLPASLYSVPAGLSRRAVLLVPEVLCVSPSRLAAAVDTERRVRRYIG